MSQSRDITGFEQALRGQVRGQVLFDAVSRGIYATDASHYQMTPVCVVIPVDQDDAVAAVKVAGEYGVPITPRAAGTSLSGQTFGEGMVLDVSRDLTRVVEVNEAEQWAIVEPGVVRDEFNAQLKPLGLHFAPDPATSNRANIGGMIGNNSSGTRSIVYGKTIDHVISCRVVLADGTVLDFEELDENAWAAKAAGEGREAELYRGVQDVIDANREEVLARYPKVMRRVAGYNLDEFVDGAGYTGDIGPRAERNSGHRPWNLAHLITGSEGTLGVLLQAKIRLTPLPKHTALCVVHFDDAIAALAATPQINTHGPSAVELLDRDVLREAQVNSATKHMATFIHGDPAAVQVVEFFGETESEAAAKATGLAESLRQAGTGYAWLVRTDAKGQSDVWNVRKLGLGLISNVKGPRKGQAFVEDACVPVDVLAEYIDRLEKVCDAEGVRYSLYAHSSVGVIHFRPAIDLHLEEDRAKMQRIAKAAFEMVVGYGGAFAGEHGDGIVRGQFIREYFGEQLYQAFREVRKHFDPKGLMNPGKIIDPPGMTEHLRYGETYRVADVPALFHYRNQGGFQLAVEQCNGVGACRKTGQGTMCPSYMATRDEDAATRGRANALRLAMSGQLNGHDLASDGVYQTLSLCLSCKACKSECPNAVDMARLKSDVLQMRHDATGTSLGAKMVGRMPDMAPKLSGMLAPLVNRMQSMGMMKLAMERLTGIDRRRPVPGFARKSLHQLLAAREAKQSPAARKAGKVVLFNDTYANWMEPHVGLAAVELLESCGYEVVLADAGCCQRPRLSKGLVREAKAKGLTTLQNLDRFAKEGLPILCLEPSCASALVDDLPDLVDDEALGERVRGAVQMIDVFLDEQVKLGKIPPLEATVTDILLHGHCHQKSLFGTDGIKSLLNEAKTCDGHGGCGSGGECDGDGHCHTEEVDSGCCGMAGSFGYEHYDVSVKVAEDRLLPAAREAAKAGKTIVACGISCRHQLKDLADIEAKHFVEVVRGTAD